jgi:predicted AlkP superfamily pyrophosphatase or phosphodiesterase
MHCKYSNPRSLASLVLALLCLLAQAPPAPGRRPTPARPQGTEAARREAQTTAPPRASADAGAARPRLVLFIAVDQFRYDYLERFGGLFAANGLRRLMREGASWTQANFDHIPTETAPGHATMLTGAWPAETGIIANDWFERAEGGDKGRRVNNVEDESAKILGGGPQERGTSPRRLLVSTLGDELRLATNMRSKIVGVSLKDRSAVLPAGRLASAAYWGSPETGSVVSSDYYFERLPEWVVRYNASRPADKFAGREWTRLLNDESVYLRHAGPDEAAWENQGAGNEKYTRAFPHKMPAAVGKDLYESLQNSPFSNDMLVEFAKLAITHEGLGADPDTDVLTVSFSANDYVGHRWGPYSQEVMDITLRTDRQIAELLDFVEARVGLRNTVVAFTADHGAAPVPEHAAELKLPGRRVVPKDVETRMRDGLRAHFSRAREGGARGADYFLEYTPKNGNVYLNLAALSRDGVAREEAERVAGDAALTMPGVARYFTRTQLTRGAISPADPVARRVLHGFHPKRGGDLVLVTEPFVLVVTYTADHFSPYSYDTHVPLLIMGAGLRAGAYAQAATPADIAPTIAALLRVQSPSNATGRVLAEALK